MGVIIKSQEWFEQKVKDFHGENVTVIGKYNGAENPIDIVYHCEKHGDTYTTLNAKNICKNYFLPCKECQKANKSMIAKAKHPHKDKNFYYEKLKKYCEERGGKLLSDKWITAKTTYQFKCHNPEHPVFETTADSLCSGVHWCPYCSGRSGDFENEINEIITSKNGQLLSPYINATTHVRVKCNIHDYAWGILPSNIKKGKWCPICRMAFNEKVVWEYFKNNMINIIPQFTFDDLLGKGNEKLKYDFAILSNNNDLVYILEVDDEEHRDNHDNSKRRQLYREYDVIKDNYCKNKNIKLYRMEVPFRNNKKWNYEDYYRYINTELMFIVNLVNEINKEDI